MLILLGVGCVESRNQQLTINSPPHMLLTSPAFSHNQIIPKKYTCDADDVSPPLEIGAVPIGAKSLVLIVDDPDAPGGDWVHWTVWNIDPKTARIEENSVPAGASEGATDFGRTGWGGPCPPFNPDRSVGAGAHRYFFKLFALDTTLNLDPNTRKVELEKALEGHILAQAELVGLYQRQ